RAADRDHRPERERRRQRRAVDRPYALEEWTCPDPPQQQREDRRAGEQADPAPDRTGRPRRGVRVYLNHHPLLSISSPSPVEHQDPPNWITRPGLSTQTSEPNRRRMRTRQQVVPRDHGGTVPAVRLGPVIGLMFQVMLLVILAAIVSLDFAGWMTG